MLQFLFGEGLRCAAFLIAQLRPAIRTLERKLCSLVHLLLDILVVALRGFAVGVRPFVALVAFDPTLPIVLSEVDLLTVVAKVVVLVLLEAGLTQVLIGSYMPPTDTFFDFDHFPLVAGRTHFIHALLGRWVACIAHVAVCLLDEQLHCQCFVVGYRLVLGLLLLL